MTLGLNGSASLTFSDPRLFKVIVLVCQQSNNQLYSGSVTVNGQTKTSLSSGEGGTLTDAQLCNVGGAQFPKQNVGSYPATVNIPQ